MGSLATNGHLHTQSRVLLFLLVAFLVSSGFVATLEFLALLRHGLEALLAVALGYTQTVLDSYAQAPENKVWRSLTPVLWMALQPTCT